MSNLVEPAPLLDARQLVAGVRWRRRIWGSFALAGLVAGALLAILAPPAPTAVARVFVVHEEDRDAGIGETRDALMETDLAVFETARIASAAAARLGLDEPAGDFLGTYHGEGLTANVLEITARGASDDAAVERAQALADVFVADHVRRTQEVADAEAESLLHRRSLVEQEVRALDARITATMGENRVGASPSEPDPVVAGQLEELNAQRLALTSQIADLAQQAEVARLGVPRVIAGTTVIDPARTVTSSLMMAVATNMVVGLVLGLGAGLALAAVLTVTRDRPVLRSDIAAHLGSSVILQLPERLFRGRMRVWRWLRRRIEREERRAVATLSRVVRHSTHPISLIEIGCPKIAARLALAIASELADDRRVTVVDDLPGGVGAMPRVDPESGIEVVPLAGSSTERPGSTGREVCIGVGSARPGTDWTDRRRLGVETILIVRAGHASTAELHTVARHLERSGIAPIGVVLVRPDRRDRSDGTLWGQSHRLMDDRIDRPAQPGAPFEGAALANAAARAEVQ